MADMEFIDGDEFDPAVADAAEKHMEELADTAPDQARALIERRKRAYYNVFNAGSRDQADVDFVLADLMWFCKVRTPTYDINDGIHAEELSKRKEGRREVFHRIQDFSRLSSDTLLLMYTDAITK